MLNFFVIHYEIITDIKTVSMIGRKIIIAKLDPVAFGVCEYSLKTESTTVIVSAETQ